MAFHARTGICFERLVDGGVRIFRHEQRVQGRCVASEKMLVELTASQWAQAVAAVSQRGTEYPGNHAEALDLHQRD